MIQRCAIGLLGIRRRVASTLKSKSQMNLRSIIGFIAVISRSAAELTITPRNTEARVGDITYFNCSTNVKDKAIFWFHGRNYVYTTQGILDLYRERYRIDRNESTGSYNLVIHSVQPGDAGKYSCADDEDSGTKHTAELVVLENSPDCQSDEQSDGVIGQNIFNIPHDEVQITCKVSYYGNIPPKMEWKKVGDSSSINDSIASDITSNQVIYTLKLKGDISLEKASYVCQTTSSTQNQYKCNSEIINVLYFVGGNMIEQKVVRGDEITCTAFKNNFPCTAQWHYGNNTFGKTITANLLGEYLCLVKCNIRGNDYSFTARKALVVGESNSPLAAVVVPIVLMLLASSVAVFVVYYMKRKYAQRKQDDLGQMAEYLLNKTVLDGETTMRNGERGNIKEEEIQLLHKIKMEPKLREKPILGVAILLDKLFLVREKKSEMEVYDMNSISLGHDVVKLSKLVAAVDICSCKRNECIYIMDKKNGSTTKEVLKYNAQAGEKSVKNWPTKNNAEGYLSAATEGNLIITVQDKQILLEYSPDGELMREIKLQHCKNPWHAIKLYNNQYIVSHGTVTNRVHRVCLVDKYGTVKIKFGRGIGSAEDQLHVPYYLAASTGGCVMVADFFNHRVLLLDSNLNFKSSVVPNFKQRFRNPRRVYLDEKRLVVVITAGHPRATISEDVYETWIEAEEGIVKARLKAINFDDIGDSRKEAEEVTAGKPRAVVVDDIQHEAEVCESSKEIHESSRPPEEGNIQIVDESKQIEENCRVLIFDIQPLLQKYNDYPTRRHTIANDNAKS